MKGGALTGGGRGQKQFSFVLGQMSLEAEGRFVHVQAAASVSIQRKCQYCRSIAFIYPAWELKFHYYFSSSDFVCIPVMYKRIQFSYSLS